MLLILDYKRKYVPCQWELPTKTKDVFLLFSVQFTGSRHIFVFLPGCLTAAQMPF